MAAAGFNLNPPESLKAVNHIMKLATEYDQRDPVISYYCRMYAVQKAMAIDRSSPDSKKFLYGLMDFLEKAKAAQRENELITNTSVAQAYVEQQAMKIFLYADQCDRAGNFSPATIKSFYTSNLLIEVLTQFGELPDEIVKCQRYAKWKAVYIKQCTSQGITPVAGPVQEEGSEEFPELSALHLGGPAAAAAGGGAGAGTGTGAFAPGPRAGSGAGFQPTPSATPYQPSPYQPSVLPNATAPIGNPYATPYQPSPSPSSNASATNYMYQPVVAGGGGAASVAYGGGGGATLSKGGSSAGIGAELLQMQLEVHAALTDKEMTACSQLCKSANSALQFQDAKTALSYFQKCIYLLTTGQIPVADK